jgi:hypothetical protein
MSTSINIIPNDNVISVQDSNNQITITSNTSNVVVDVTQPITNTVQVLTGPQGQKGDQGPVGPSGSSANIDTGSLATTGSNVFIGNQTITGSLIQGLAGNIAIGDYSHAEGFETRTGITTAYSASVVSGIITMSAVYGDTSTNFLANERVYLYDAPFDDAYGREIFIISQSSFDGTNTIVELANNNSSTSKAYILSLDNNLNNNSGDQIIPGNYSHAEGDGTQAIGNSSHAEGSSKALGSYSHAEGSSTAVGAHSHAEGGSTQAIGDYSHAEGIGTKAIGEYSHAEGDYTQAIGDYSHAEGQETIASGSYSHAEGYQTIALANRQHVQGQWNAASSVESAFIVGNGTDDGNRSNLIHAAGNEVQISGNTSLASVQENLVLIDGTPSPSHSFDYNLGSIFYLTRQTEITTWNVINLPTTTEKAITLTFIIEQRSIAYSASEYQFNGDPISVKWPQGIVPTGSANTVDAIGLTAFNVGSTWTVLGSLTPFV